MKLEPLVLPYSDFGKEMNRFFYEEHFDYLITIVGEDFPEEGLGCIYLLENTQTHRVISIKSIAERIGEDYVLPSVISLWKGADLLEREVYDFFGIKFIGHPDMRRLFLRNDFQGYPLRKDYDMSEEKNHFSLKEDFESDFTTEYSIDTHGELVSTRKRLFSDDDFVVNIGPQHPSTHGVLRLKTLLNGEYVNRVYPHCGYIHRGIEKMCEGYTYPQTLALTDRLDYLSATMNRHTLCRVIEEALGVELPQKVLYIRTIVDELQRLSSHLLYIGCCAQDVGALTAFLYTMRDREHVLNVLEETTGGRLIQNYYRIGGLQEDIDKNFVKNTKDLCKYLKPMFQEYMGIFGNNLIMHNRFQNVGGLSTEKAINYGVSGASGRASNWKNDIRKTHPYALYDRVDFKEVIMGEGDSFARFMVRIAEMKQSIHIIEQLIDNIPEGDFYVKQKPVMKLPEGMWYTSCEGSRGEFGVYLHSTGGISPYRLKFKPMGLNLVGVMDNILRGEKVADLIVVGASLDFVIPDIDR